MIEQAYSHALTTPSDIHEHLPVFEQLVLGHDAQNVIELGTRFGVSTLAWLRGVEQTGGLVWTVDTVTHRIAADGHPQLRRIQGDDRDQHVLDQLPDQAEIVFVDTSHLYEHTVVEIGLYQTRVAPGGVMVFHDTNVETFEHHTADDNQPPFPVRRAVDEWLAETGYESSRFENCHGLTIVYIPA